MLRIINYYTDSWSSFRLTLLNSANHRLINLNTCNSYLYVHICMFIAVLQYKPGSNMCVRLMCAATKISLNCKILYLVCIMCTGLPMKVLLKLRTLGDIALAPSFFSLFEQAEYFRLNLLND